MKDLEKKIKELESKIELLEKELKHVRRLATEAHDGVYPAI